MTAGTPDGTGRGKRIALLAGPIVGVVLGLALRANGMAGPACWCAGVTAVCAVWWITEPIALAATALLPFAIFPLTGVLDHGEVATAYGHTLIMLLLGGFMLSTAMEKSGAHRRLALAMVRAVGGGGRRLVLGFMVATAVLSMWISNTATVLMLLPVVLATLEDDDPRAVPLLLGVAYAASIGGIGTPVGTPPNVILMGVYQEQTGQEISFLSWMGIGVPLVVVFLPLVWLWLTRNLPRDDRPAALPAPGPWRAPERRVLVLFALTALAWVTRSAPFGGWSAALGIEGAGDATVALAAVALAFVTPDGEGDRLLDWPTAAKIPWGLLLLFGGGIAIARAFGATGLSATLGALLSGLAAWPTAAMVLAIAATVTFLTEVTSNTATTSLLMPILASAAVAAGLEPRWMMIPAAMSASCAFMLPVATAPNAIVYGTGRVPSGTMAREGFVLNFVGALCVTGVVVLLL